MSCQVDEDYTETVYYFQVYNSSSIDSLLVKYKLDTNMNGTTCGGSQRVSLSEGSTILTPKAVDFGISACQEVVEMTKVVPGLNNAAVANDAELREFIKELEIYTINELDTQLAIPSSDFQKLSVWSYTLSGRDKKTYYERKEHIYSLTITDDMLKQ